MATQPITYTRSPFGRVIRSKDQEDVWSCITLRIYLPHCCPPGDTSPTLALHTSYAMPIPPRPVPRAHRRPGHSVPHKSASSSPAKISSNAAGLLDWRAEVAFLDSFAASKPHSMPSAGVVIMGAATRARDRERAAALAAQAQTGTAGAGAAETTEGSTGRREVGLEVLIADGRGKREKRGV